MTFLLILVTVGIVILMAWWVDKTWPKPEPPKEEKKPIITPDPAADYTMPKAIAKRYFDSPPGKSSKEILWGDNDEFDRRIRGG